MHKDYLSKETEDRKEGLRYLDWAACRIKLRGGSRHVQEKGGGLAGGLDFRGLEWNLSNKLLNAC